MGKTKLLRKFRRTHPPVFDSTVGVQKMQIVAMQMPPEPDEKSFCTQLLSSLDAPVRTSMNVHQMRHIVRDLRGFVGGCYETLCSNGVPYLGLRRVVGNLLGTQKCMQPGSTSNSAEPILVNWDVKLISQGDDLSSPRTNAAFWRNYPLSVVY